MSTSRKEAIPKIPTIHSGNNSIQYCHDYKDLGSKGPGWGISQRAVKTHGSK